MFVNFNVSNNCRSVAAQQARMQQNGSNIDVEHCAAQRKFVVGQTMQELLAEIGIQVPSRSNLSKINAGLLLKYSICEVPSAFGVGTIYTICFKYSY